MNMSSPYDASVIILHLYHRRYFMPESDYDVEYFVRAAHDAGQKLRVVSVYDYGH